MKKFLKRLLIFTVLFFVVDKLFYIFIYLSPNYQVDNRIEKLLEGEINKEVIILGSSRGAMNIMANQLEAQTAKSAYNIAFPGSDVTFHDFILKTLLKFNKKPKIIIFALDSPSELLPTASINYRFDRLYPLVKYDYINQELINKGDRNFTSWFLCLSRLNKTNLSLKRNSTKFDNVQPDGSTPLDFENPNFKADYILSVGNYEIKDESDEKRKAFKSILDQCQSNNIKLIFAFSPNFQIYNIAFEKRMRQFKTPNSSFFVYDSLNSSYKDASNFYDESHLNAKGAKIFTSELSNYINLNQ
ncbi:hypothetical protein ACFPVY_15375 [Flavobacterium qiangtangense]|uniref:DUF1574 domain-containing protein n=1 Tax=Flavobacterium qiangtangense TaxID=1442595 RepID=A0ABW1PQV3_9FLAO